MPHLVQSKTSTTGGVTLDAAPTPGNILLGWGAIRSGAWDYGVGQQFTLIANITESVRQGSMVYRVVQLGDPAGGWDSPNQGLSTLMEWAPDGDEPIVLDVYVSLSDQGPTSPPFAMSCGGPVTPTAGQGAVIVGGASIGNGDLDIVSVAPDADWTELVDAWGGLSPFSWVGYRIVAETAGSYTAGGTVSDGHGGPDPWGGVTAVLTDGPPPPPPPPDPGQIFEIYDPGDVFIATLGDATKKSIRIDLDGTGVGQFEINRYSADATSAILKGGNLVKVTIPRIDPDPIFSFFLEDEGIKLVSTDEEGGENIQITGRGGLAYPERAIWLAQSFVIPWWVSGTPSAGDIGQVEVAAGTHTRYIITAGKISSTTTFSVGAFDAFYDQRRTFYFTSGHGTLHRQLVHLSSGPHAGWWLHAFDDGITDHPSEIHLNGTILLTDISPDKPGAVLYRLWQEAVSADRIVHPTALWTVDFSATVDSNGDPWTTTDALVGVTADLGETYLTTIGKLLGTGVIDVVMSPDLLMSAFNLYGRDLTGPAFGAGVVRFVKGVNIADELVRELKPAPVATWAQVIGTDDTVASAELADAGSRIPRETNVRGETNDATALAALGLAELNRQLVASDAIGFRVTAVDDDEDTGKYLPGPPGSAHGKYWIGDIVRLHTGTGEQDFDEADERVAAITIAEDDAQNLEVTVELGSALGGGNGLLASAGGSGVIAGSTITTSSIGTDLMSHGDLLDLDADDHPQYATDADLDAVKALDFLVGTATGLLSAEIPVGTTPGGELGGTWASPTVDATHSGSAHSDFIAKSVLTTQDDIIVRSATVPDRLGKGSDGQVLTVDPTTHHLVWATPSSGASFATPAIVLGSAAAGGAASTVIRSDSTIAAFDTTDPTTQALGDAAAVGTVAFAARRDHKHAMPALSTATPLIESGSGAAGSAAPSSREDHVHPASSGSGTLSTVEEVDASPTDSAVTKLVFPNGTLSITSHVATYTPAAGAAARPYPLDRYAIDGTYGDDFTGASLSGLWTRRNFTSGAETYQVGYEATFLRIAMNGRALGDGYFQTAAGGDWTIAAKMIQRVYPMAAFGIAVVDTNGTGVGVMMMYPPETPRGPLMVGITTYTSYGGHFRIAGVNGTDPGTGIWLAQPIEMPIWMKLRKSGTNYYEAISLDGEAWSNESSALVWAGTVDRYAMMILPPSGTGGTDTVVDVDWFNKIA